MSEGNPHSLDGDSNENLTVFIGAAVTMFFLPGVFSILSLLKRYVSSGKGQSKSLDSPMQEQAAGFLFPSGDQDQKSGESSSEETSDTMDHDSLEDLVEIEEMLSQNLNTIFRKKIQDLKADILLRKLEFKRQVDDMNKDKKEEQEVVESKYKAEMEEVNDKYVKEYDKLQIECVRDIRKIKDSLKDLKVVLSTTSDDQDRLETGRQELECPVCFEEMKPPRRIWQCADGHTICELCRKKPEVTCCPSCRKYFTGRSNIAEKLARAVFGDCDSQKEQVGEDKITLTGYKQSPSGTQHSPLL